MVKEEYGEGEECMVKEGKGEEYGEGGERRRVVKEGCGRNKRGGRWVFIEPTYTTS